MGRTEDYALCVLVYFRAKRSQTCLVSRRTTITGTKLHRFPLCTNSVRGNEGLQKRAGQSHSLQTRHEHEADGDECEAYCITRKSVV